MVARKILYRLCEVRIGKICLSQSPFDITRQASCCQTVIIGTIFFYLIQTLIIGPRREKTCLREVANNTGADQPVHPHSLFSAFVIRFLEGFICKLAMGEISIF